jgi:outer membrane receptor for ferrienterochelin and colicin
VGSTINHMFVFKFIKYFLSYLFIFFTFSSIAQTVTISGFITDTTSGEVLPGATLINVSTGKGSSANQYGFYSLTSSSGTTRLRFTFVGYKPVQLELHLTTDTTIQVQLNPAISSLNEVIVEAKPEEVDNISSIPYGKIKMPVSRLKAIPGLLGEQDIIKALALLPGVSVGNEGSTGLLVRGGTPDQNLIILDDATVYNVSHLFGFLSVFNSDAIKNVELYKGGFPARYGGRLSSVLDVSMKEGNNQKVTGEAGIGMINSRLLLEGPIIKNKSSFMIAARSATMGLFQLPAMIAYNYDKSDRYFNYWLYDINAKFNYKFKDNSQLFLSLYRGNDNFLIKERMLKERSQFDNKWGNLTATARYNRVLNQKLFFRSILAYSYYNYGIASSHFLNDEEGKKVPLNHFSSSSSVKDISFRNGFDYYYSSRHQLRFGTDLIRHIYQPVTIEASFLLNQDSLKKINTPLSALENAWYAEDEVSITERLKVNVGMRVVGFNVQGKSFYSLEPRLTANLIMPHNLTLKGGYSRMRQFMHLITSTNVGLPNDIWLPATKNAPPPTASQYGLGISKALGNSIELSIEGYYKKTHSIIDNKPGSNLLTSFNVSWEELVEKYGEGEAYGLEVLANKTSGALTGWVAYTFAMNNRRFENINQGNWYPAPFDRRHTLNITGAYDISHKLSLSATWAFHTGQPVTMPIALYEQPENGYPEFIYKDINNFRMPSYHRLDIGLTYKRVTKRNRDASWHAGVYNAYNRINPYYLDFNQRYYYEQKQSYGASVTGVNSQLSKMSVIPLLPYIGYSIKF